MESGYHPQQSASFASGVPESLEVNKANQPSPATPNLDKLAKFVQTRPLLFWGGVWVSILCVSIVALSGLLSPGMSNGNRASGAAIGERTTPAPVTNQDHRIPLWLFGAIALSCTAGSVLLSKHVARPSFQKAAKAPGHQPTTQRASKSKRLQAYLNGNPSPHLIQPHPQQGYQAVPVSTRSPVGQPRPTQPTTALPPKPRTAASELQRLEALATAGLMPSRPTRPHPKSKPHPASKPLKAKTKAAKPTRTKATKPTRVAVTVVPPNENHPLDLSEASLVDKLDLRRQRPISSWM